jgi:hypothetical protein
MLLLIELMIRPLINANLLRIARFYRVHSEAQTCDQPIALILRSFGQIHGYLDSQSGFSILWFLDDALRRTNLRPALLGTETSLPQGHGTLLYPSRDENWQAIFVTFADAAAVIFFVPELTPSLATELGVMRDRGWLEKTIIIMAPESIGARTAGGDDRTRQVRWEEARAAHAATGITMPTYDPAGALIEITSEGSVSVVTRLGLDWRTMQPGGFWDSLFHSASPEMPERREQFCRLWQQI